MASIVKRNKKYAVVFSYITEEGEKKQKWETFPTKAEAAQRKKIIEYEQSQGTFIVPSSTTIEELLNEYVEVYGKNAWSISTYSNRLKLINNYILPLIGDIKIDDVIPRMMDKFYMSLTKVNLK